MTLAGAHTVGAPDGGPGLPGTGWSREHGDIRVAHFLGLHALQILPLAAAAVRQARAGRRFGACAWCWAIAASYVSLFGLLLWQALRGQSVTAPDATTMTALAAVGGADGGGSWIAALALANLRASMRSFIEEQIMTPNQIFSIANAVALCGWLLLVVLPRKKWVDACRGRRRSSGRVGRCLHRDHRDAFLRQRRRILVAARTWRGSSANPWLLLAGWIHYLAFDLLVGSWEARDARERGIRTCSSCRA